MKETDLHFFIDCTNNYFDEMTKEKAVIGIPYLKDEKPLVLEFTGIIGISGKRKGSIYITSSREMLVVLTKEILSVEDVTTDDIKDLIGEIANTISGNVRQAYGSDFMISVPVVVEGQARDIKMPDDIQSFVIPLTWKNYNSYLVVCLS
ncbi:MAG: chemotaxis protein CheX [Calditrichaeota bacterium]|nr:MAG: chemotaxis protein CheX [Calditrichota bacterium]MBL1206127.1 chemotaxis protein CheX [Calditrichota bacterium]NOG45952.1 chemotaxis protein CheX [Calditrichota bacterium]